MIASAQKSALGIPRLTRSDESAGWVGIDVGSTCLKVAQVRLQRSRWSLQMAKLIPAPGGSMNLECLSSGVVGSLIRDNCSRPVLSRMRKVACTISAALMEMQTMELPAGPADETRAMIGLEMQEGNREFDFFVGENVEGQGAESRPHFVFSIPTEAAAGLGESLWRQRAYCQRIDTLPCLHARAVQMIDPAVLQDCVAVLDWGGSAPVITLLSMGRPVFSRVLRGCGIGSLTAAASEVYHLDSEEVTAILCHQQQSGSSGGRTAAFVEKLAEDTMQQMQQELSRTVQYLRRHVPKLQPQRLWLMGGGALLPHITERLEQWTGWPTIRWQLPAETNAPCDPMHAVFAQAIALSSLGSSRS